VFYDDERSGVELSLGNSVPAEADIRASVERNARSKLFFGKQSERKVLTLLIFIFINTPSANREVFAIRCLD